MSWATSCTHKESHDGCAYFDLDPRGETSALLSREEDQLLDFNSRGILPKKLAKHFSAFANADGGVLCIGIKNNKRWNGFESPEHANAHLQAVAAFRR